MLLAIGYLALATPAHSLMPVCNPEDVTARILQSANPNDIHKDWRGESRIGTAWSLIKMRRVEKDGVEYLRGTLISPRGGAMGEVYVLRTEWDCR